MARLEGGTFAVILPNCGLGEAVDVMDRVRAATRATRPARPVSRAGTARSPPSCSTSAAEDALTAAKQAGRNMTLAAE